MYNNVSAPLATATGTGTTALAVTGADMFWYVLAGFALIAAGMALLRILPRRKPATTRR